MVRPIRADAKSAEIPLMLLDKLRGAVIGAGSESSRYLTVMVIFCETTGGLNG